MTSKTLPILILLVMAGGDLLAGEKEDFLALEKASAAGKSETQKLAREFTKRYPFSQRAPLARHLAARSGLQESETDTMLVSLFRDYPRYEKRIQVAQELCELRILGARWSDLASSARLGIDAFGGNASGTPFRFALVYAYMRLDKNDEAERELDLIIQRDNSRATAARVMLTRAYLARRSGGYSREYMYHLREAGLAFPSSELTPGIILLLAEFYREVGEEERAFSAYSDLAARYPKSPEGEMARSELSRFSDTSRRIVPYLPDESTVKKYSSIDIRPEINIDNSRTGPEDYAVSIGPLPTLEGARDIARQIGEFGQVTVIQVRRGYLVITGRSKSRDQVHQSRVRLAEEFGFNGTIIRFEKKDGREYIHGE